MKIAIVIALAAALIALIRRKLLQVDVSFPWFVALILLSFLSLSDRFISWIAGVLGIIYEPIAIVLLTIFILLGITTFLAVVLTKIRLRQIGLVRHMMRSDLARQEDRLDQK